MARKKKTTAIANWDEELAKHASAQQAMEASTSMGTFFSFRGGRLAFNDNPFPDNQVAIVILDHVLENVYYEDDFDPENIASPSCYAFGREEKMMAPHENVESPESESCVTCPQNEWGSSSKGKGKACANRRRLAVIPAGEMDKGRFIPFKKAEDFGDELAFMKLPVTSVRGYSSYVNNLANVLGRPTWAVWSLCKVIPDDRSQFKVVFETLGKIPNSLLPYFQDRAQEAGNQIEFPYQKMAEEAPPPKRKKRTTKKKKSRRKY